MAKRIGMVVRFAGVSSVVRRTYGILSRRRCLEGGPRIEWHLDCREDDRHDWLVGGDG